MAEERDDAQRTEEPTGRRLDEARKKGDVVKSMEVSSFVMLAAGTLAFATLSGTAARTFNRKFLAYLQSPAEMVLDSGAAAGLLHQAVFDFFLLMAPVLAVLTLAAAGGHLVQTGFIASTERLKPSLSKISPMAGFKRLFGLDGLVNFVKGIAKIVLVGAAAVAAAWPERARIATAIDVGPAGMMAIAFSLIIRVLIAVLVVYAIISVVDYVYQRQRFFARHRMTRQELREEMKQSEGDPQIKARIRQVRLDRSRKRMMAAVPNATVVITNPTHYAVALRYESGKMGAPVCVAKGADHLALTIRKLAEEHDVPIVENPPLARALFASVELDAEIPEEHYKAVAQVIGYVMRLAARSKFWKN
jgi:flagellar biosynthetic protein FlhB